METLLVSGSEETLAYACAALCTCTDDRDYSGALSRAKRAAEHHR